MSDTNHDQFAHSGNPWIAPGCWDREVAIAQDPLAPTAQRRSALDFVRPGAPEKSAPIAPQVITHVTDKAHEKANRMRRVWRDLRREETNMVPITPEDVATFRRSVAKIQSSTHDKELPDFQTARHAHAEWMASERAAMATQRKSRG